MSTEDRNKLQNFVLVTHRTLQTIVDKRDFLFNDNVNRYTLGAWKELEGQFHLLKVRIEELNEKELQSSGLTGQNLNFKLTILKEALEMKGLFLFQDYTLSAAFGLVSREEVFSYKYEESVYDNFWHYWSSQYKIANPHMTKSNFLNSLKSHLRRVLKREDTLLESLILSIPGGHGIKEFKDAILSYF